MSEINMCCLFSSTLIVQINMEQEETVEIESDNNFPHHMETLLAVGEMKIRKELKSKFERIKKCSHLHFR